MATILSPHTTPSSTEPGAPTSATPKALWITVGVLAVVSSALGAALVMKSHDQPAATPVQAASALPAIAPADGTPVQDKPMLAQPQPESHAQAAAHPRSPAPVKHPVSHAAPAAGEYPVAQAPAAAHAVCSSCGTVESVQPVTVKGQGSGLGVAGGAVAGGLLGHQMGGGNGKAALTVLGALGGAFAGNEVEKTARATTEYEVQVRMEDGSVRTVRQSQPIAAGTHVRVNNGSLSVASN
ncbi:glycine zipper 2TM domain-containing protein [Ramlibacter sp.]|nr:glycine zipper 2TM domain-containing protein [Ramlibacter sp.]